MNGPDLVELANWGQYKMAEIFKWIFLNEYV